MWEIAIWFLLFVYAINGFLVYFDSAITSYDIISPFTNSTMSLPSLPDVNATLTSKITGTTGTNSTGGASIGIWDVANYTWNATIFFIQFLTGAFLWSALAAFGMPALFVVILQGVVFVFVAITIMHFWRGIF